MTGWGRAATDRGADKVEHDDVPAVLGCVSALKLPSKRVPRRKTVEEQHVNETGETLSWSQT